MKLTIGTKIGGGFALALLALVLIGVIAYRSTSELIDAAAVVDHTNQVRQALEQFLSTLKDAETGQRGFIITGEERYLQPYTDAVSTIKPELKNLRSLTQENADQQKELDALEPLVAAKLEELKEAIDLRRDPVKGFDDARAFVLTDKGKATMDQIRLAANAMEDEENALMKQHLEEANRSADQTHASIIGGTVVAFAVLFVAGLGVTRNISTPLNEISRVAERIGAGDLTEEVTPYDRSDEVGQLSLTFARMNRSLQEMASIARSIALGDLRVQVKPQSEKDLLGNAFATMAENLRRSTGDMAEGVNVLASSASEILASTSQVASSAAETGTAIAQTTSTVEEVRQTAQMSSQKAKLVADMAQKTSQIAINGRKSVEASVDGMKRIQSQMESIGESVVKLSEQGQSIGEIIASVNDLAEQSNLLAVNAAIEAAKAGEQGKGFAVVAQEIKSLADQSKQATAQVRTILGEIQKATTAAVLVTEQGNKAVEAGFRQASEAGDSIRLLAENIAEAAQVAMQISASSQQQLVGTDQVALAMENIKQASVQNVAGTRQAETAAHNLHELGQKLKHLVDQYKL